MRRTAGIFLPMVIPKSALKSLRDILTQRITIIRLIGIGYTCQLLGLKCATLGCKVFDFDFVDYKLPKLHIQHSRLQHINKNIVAEANIRGLRNTADFNRSTRTNRLFLCIPVPLNKCLKLDQRLDSQQRNISLPRHLER